MLNISTKNEVNPNYTTYSSRNSSEGGNTSTDFSGLNASTQKTDTSTESSQTGKGVVEKYTLSTSNCSVGQPLMSDFSSGIITARPITSLPAQHKVVGFSLSDALVGSKVDILKEGFCTVRTTTTYAGNSNTIALNSSTNNSTNSITNSTTFTDSGVDNDYSSNENYQITFDAGNGYTIDMVINNFNFEHSTYQMYDRMGFQTSSDGISFTNANVEWLQKSATSIPPWSNSFAGSSWNSASSKNGYILPENTPRAILIGGVPSNSFPATIGTGARYVRFFFISDGSSQDTGWNITLQPDTPYSSNANTVAIDTPMYLDSSDFTKVTTDNTSGLLLGYCAYQNVENDSVYISVNT